MSPDENMAANSAFRNLANGAFLGYKDANRLVQVAWGIRSVLHRIVEALGPGDDSAAGAFPRQMNAVRETYRRPHIRKLEGHEQQSMSRAPE